MPFRLRAMLYVVLMTALVVPWASFIVLCRLAPAAFRYRLAQGWTKIAIRTAEKLCGLSWKVEGAAHLPPQGSAVVLCKHQSSWETFWLPSYLPGRLSFVYKRELHWLPFFGWGMASLGMINIDRSRGQDAFEQVVTQGEKLLRDGWWIVIFPEGTRTPPGSTRRYKTGGARLAVRTGVPVVPIAVNSGELWPRGPLIRRPGEITVSIGPPIETRGKTSDQVAAEVEAWIETEMRRLAPHRYAGPYQPQPHAAGGHAAAAAAAPRAGA